MDQLDELLQRPHWWLVMVNYGRKLRRWEPIAVFKYEAEASAYVDRHNSHEQAGRYRKMAIADIMDLASSAESSLKPNLPVAEAMLVGNAASTSDVNAPGA